MDFPINYSDEDQLRRAFSWLTRIGAGVKFGSRPIGWYQVHQCYALDYITELVGTGKVRCRRAVLYAQSGTHGTHWFVLTDTNSVFDEADRRSRSAA